MEDTQRGAQPQLAPRARTALVELAERLGAIEIPRFATWLVAAVDQHAAEVRDALVDPYGRIPVVRLAAYADGVLDTAERYGWRLDASGGSPLVSSSPVSWPLLRLLAVCTLMPAAV